MLAVSSANSRYLTKLVNFNCIYSLSSNFSSATDVSANVARPEVSAQLSPARHRKGAGGRASFSGNVVTVFGANGLLGQALVNRLAKFGNQIIVPYRCDPYWVRDLKISGDLGQILFFPFNLNDEDAIRKALKYSNVVINLIGTRVNTKNFSMYDTHEHGARRIARIAREVGVNRLIHLSAMGADPDYKSGIVKSGDFLRSKGRGEIAVREEFPDATIIRPSVMYGEMDNFIYHYLTHSRKNFADWVKVYKRGEETYKMPIYIGDVSMGIYKAVTDPTSAGKIYEFVGPHNYKLAELLTFMFKKARVIQRAGYNLQLHDHWDPYYTLNKIVFGLWGKIFRKHNRFNMQWIEYLEGSSDFLSGNPTIGDLGVTHLAEFENIGSHHCILSSFIRQLEERYMEYDMEPPLPLRTAPIFKGQPIPPPNEVPFFHKYFLIHAVQNIVVTPFRNLVDEKRDHPRTIGYKSRKTAHLENFN